MLYGHKLDATQYEADAIITIGETIYIGRLKPTYDKSSDAPSPEDQPVWQIEQLQKENQTTYIEGNQVEMQKILRKYPNGNDAYKYILNEAANYTYEFRK